MLAFGRSSNAGPIGNPTDLTERLRESFYLGISEEREKSDSREIAPPYVQTGLPGQMVGIQHE